jgi:hypothetical protein
MGLALPSPGLIKVGGVVGRSKASPWFTPRAAGAFTLPLRYTLRGFPSIGMVASGLFAALDAQELLHSTSIIPVFRTGENGFGGRMAALGAV